MSIIGLLCGLARSAPSAVTTGLRIGRYQIRALRAYFVAPVAPRNKRSLRQSILRRWRSLMNLVRWIQCVVIRRAAVGDDIKDDYANKPAEESYREPEPEAVPPAHGELASPVPQRDPHGEHQ